MQEHRAEGVGPSCGACIFGPINDDGHGKCDHIVHWNRKWHPVSNKWIASNNVTTAEARAESGLCGPEALLFQSYSFKGNIFKRLAKTNPYWLFMGPILAVGIGAALFFE